MMHGVYLLYKLFEGDSRKSYGGSWTHSVCLLALQSHPVGTSASHDICHAHLRINFTSHGSETRLYLTVSGKLLERSVEKTSDEVLPATHWVLFCLHIGN